MLRSGFPADGQTSTNSPPAQEGGEAFLAYGLQVPSGRFHPTRQLPKGDRLALLRTVVAFFMMRYSAERSRSVTPRS